MDKVVSLTERIESQENELWDRRARALGFANFAALEEANNAEFEAAFESLQASCTHADKHPELGMCENCAELLPP